MPPRRSKRPRHPSEERLSLRSPAPFIAGSPHRACRVGLLPVEVVAEVLEWLGDRGWKGKGLAPARLVSRKWQEALGEVMERRAHCDWIERVSWGQEPEGLPRCTQRLALLSLPFMSTTFHQTCSNLEIWNRIDDRTVSLLTPLKKVLTDLSIQEGQLSLTSVRELQRLESLHLWSPQEVTAPAWKAIAGLRRLSRLVVYDCRRSPGLGNLCASATIESLDLDDVDITDEQLAGLKYPKLEELQLESCSLLTDVGLSCFLTCARLKTLNVRLCKRVSDNGFSELCTLTHLGNLTLHGLKITDKCLEFVGRCEQLTDLSVEDCPKITHEGVKHLTRLRRLESVSLRKLPRVTDAIADYLCQLRCRSVTLDSCPRLTDQALIRLAKARTISEFSVEALPLITDRGVKSLIKLRVLSELTISELPLITDASVDALKRIRTLKRLAIDECKHVADFEITVDDETDDDRDGLED